MFDVDPHGLIDTVVDGRYRILSFIGSGGMGSVYRAEHVTIRRPIALKFLHPEFARSPEVARRFEREAYATGRIDHPNCVTVQDFGKLADGSLYLVMELLEGQSLADRLLAEGRLAPLRALHILRHVLHGLGHAHRAGIVHRDVKPDNIVIGPDDAVHLMDFGLLRRTEDSAIITAKGEFVGTVRYASPEHMRGEKVDARGDLYSLGVLIYEMVAGARPHDGRDTMRLARDVAYGAMPRPLHETAPDVPQEVSALVQQLLAHRAEDRPASAKEVVEAIDRIVH